MAELPISQTSMNPPFTNVSINYCGPFPVYKKRTRFARPSEICILIIICLSTKAVHAQIVGELNITSTLAAIYCFISKRGPPKSILSDSASPFVSIQKAIKGQTSSRSILTDWNALKGTEWRFTPGNSPHMNGLAESCVKSLKKSLTVSIGMQRITYDELHTIVSQVECMLNSRPLVLNVRTDDINPFTPAMLLTG
jgi:transposase InsO family protein